MFDAMIKRLDPETRAAVKELEKRDPDLFGASFTQELFQSTRGTDLTVLDKAVNYMRILPQAAEDVNRVVVAAAAYDLAEGSHEAKKKAASEAVYQTQFVYAEANKPRWFKPRFAGGRAILMFKMYAQGMYALTLLPLLRVAAKKKQGIPLSARDKADRQDIRRASWRMHTTGCGRPGRGLR